MFRFFGSSKPAELPVTAESEEGAGNGQVANEDDASRPEDSGQTDEQNQSANGTAAETNGPAEPTAPGFAPSPGPERRASIDEPRPNSTSTSARPSASIPRSSLAVPLSSMAPGDMFIRLAVERLIGMKESKRIKDFTEAGKKALGEFDGAN